MCGRFNMDEDNPFISGVIDEVRRGNPDAELKTGEIFPTNTVPVILSGGAAAAQWGLPPYNGSKPIINARSETVAEKFTFRDSFRNKRCLIPCTGYYEWDSSKRKNLITLSKPDAFYLGGLYKVVDGVLRFAIITAASRGITARIHGRMPIILPQNLGGEWLNNFEFARDYSELMNPDLDYKTES